MRYHESPRKINAEGEKLRERLRATRHALGETQKDFSHRFGVSLSTYLNWENFGPPNMVAHRGYVRLMLQKLNQRDVRN